MCLIACGERDDAATATIPPAPVTSATTLGTTFATVCATCHGVKGEGNIALKNPSIAGLPDWYVLQQLNKF